jgi:flagellar basal body rod protein FlgG
MIGWSQLEFQVLGDPLRRADMDSGYYAACTGLAAQIQELELVANNLANLATTGYRAAGDFPVVSDRTGKPRFESSERGNQ